MSLRLVPVSRAGRKTIEVCVRVHKDVPLCCRSQLLKFAAADRYQGGGEPGDQIRCGCGNDLVYDHRGWRLASGRGGSKRAFHYHGDHE